jgi:hypothetical protein
MALALVPLSLGRGASPDFSQRKMNETAVLA